MHSALCTLDAAQRGSGPRPLPPPPSSSSPLSWLAAPLPGRSLGVLRNKLAPNGEAQDNNHCLFLVVPFVGSAQPDVRRSPVAPAREVHVSDFRGSLGRAGVSSGVASPVSPCCEHLRSGSKHRKQV